MGLPLKGFSAKKEKIVTECLPLEIHQTVLTRGAQGGLLDWLEATRIPGGFLSQSQRTSPGALEAPFLSTTASPNPTPHWSRTLPFHGQLAIISIM